MLSFTSATSSPHDDYFTLFYWALVGFSFNRFSFSGKLLDMGYMVKEDGKIVANVGVYPATYYVCGKEFKVGGLTSVAVHHRARSKGYMRELMNMALGDMRKDGIALVFLAMLFKVIDYPLCVVEDCLAVSILLHFPVQALCCYLNFFRVHNTPPIWYFKTLRLMVSCYV